MISSPSAQIVNAVAEATWVTVQSGHRVAAYGPVMGVATAIIAVGIMVTTAFGPEKRGRRFETVVAGVEETPAKKIDLEAGGDENKAQDEMVELADQKR